MSGWTNYQVSSAGAVVDPASVRKNSGRQIDWDAVPDSYRATAKIVKASAAAIATATSISVDALTVALPKNTVLVFGTGEFAKLTAAAALGSTSITVEALVNGIEDNDEAVYAGAGAKTIKAFTAMTDTGSGKIAPTASQGGSPEMVLQTPAVEGDRSAALTGYGCYVGGVFYENLMADYSNASWSTFKTALEALGFQFETYEDDMA